MIRTGETPMENSKLAHCPCVSVPLHVTGISQLPHGEQLWVFGWAAAQTLNYDPSTQGSLLVESSLLLFKTSLLSSLTFHFIHLVPLMSHSGFSLHNYVANSCIQAHFQGPAEVTPA